MLTGDGTKLQVIFVQLMLLFSYYPQEGFSYSPDGTSIPDNLIQLKAMPGRDMIRLFLKRKKNKTIWPTSSSDMHGPVACQYHTQEISHKYNYWGAHKEYLESLIQSVHPLLKIAADQAHQMHPRRQKIL